MIEYFDISMDISADMKVYKGMDSKKPVVSQTSDYNKGDFFESKIDMNLHTGTHIDSPLHFVAGGQTIDKITLDRFITKCKVVSCTKSKERIGIEDLQDKGIEEGDFILLKSRNSLEDILESNFIYLDRDGAAYLAQRKIKGIGTDALGIERAQPAHETHKTLLNAGIVILEGLRLKDVEDGEYLLVAPPLKIKGAEAAPARAILIKNFSF